jgi:hypothetical protein
MIPKIDSPRRAANLSPGGTGWSILPLTERLGPGGVEQATDSVGPDCTRKQRKHIFDEHSN